MIEAPTRRGFLAGLVAVIAAPAIVRATNIMPVKSLEPIVRARNTLILPQSIYRDLANYPELRPHGFKLYNNEALRAAREIGEWNGVKIIEERPLVVVDWQNLVRLS